MTDRQLQHFFWRAGFGINLKELEQFKGANKKQVIDHLFDRSSKSQLLDYDLSRFTKIDPKKLSKKQRQELRKEANKAVLELNGAWLMRMLSTEAVLREKMTFFFHDHFACRLKNPVVVKELNEILRRNALENFGTMLHEVSKSPAMILFLNNQQNKKEHPNENFAREVMELFTLGRDNGYSEKDIQEAARAFTGWATNKEFKFVFRAKHHDNGEKTVLGKTGNFGGEDIIDLLLEDQRTAEYLTRKISYFLVGPHVGQDDIMNWSIQFYKSNYNIETLLRSILESDVFLDEQTIGSRIKSPTELLVGLSRLIPIDYKEPKAVLQMQRKLNQVLFFPPNVAGWTSGRGWIDSSTLLFRMKFPSLVLNYGEIEWFPDETLNENMMERRENRIAKLQERVKKKVNAHPDWGAIKHDLIRIKDRLSTVLLQKDPVAQFAIGEEPTLEDIVQLLSLPEYQLC